MLTGRQEIDGKLYAFGDDGALQEETTQETKPVEAKPSIDKQIALDDQLKAYIQSEVKAQLAKLKIKMEE